MTVLECNILVEKSSGHTPPETDGRVLLKHNLDKQFVYIVTELAHNEYQEGVGFLNREFLDKLKNYQPLR